MIMIESQTHYQDIYVFTNHAWDVAASRNKEMIKNNLHVCFCETALNWHTIEFSDIEKKIMWALLLKKNEFQYLLNNSNLKFQKQLTNCNILHFL